jgi:ferredoxin
LRDELRRRHPADAGRGYLASFVFSGTKTGALVRQLIHACRGRMLAQESADRLWQERFDTLKIKKLAPSLISTKVVVPLDSLMTVLQNSERIKQPLAVEGTILQDGDGRVKAVLLGFIPHDERKPSYNLAYGLALSFIKLAAGAGGRPCATGIYFKRQAGEIIGAARLNRLISQKKTIDPQNILNPGKVIPRDALDLFMALAWRLEPLIRFLANRLPRPPRPANPGAVSWQAYSCDQCGFCLAGCPPFRGWESQGQRGRWYLLRLVMEGRLRLEEVVDKFQLCNQCEECNIVCPQGLPPLEGRDAELGRQLYE